MTIYINYLLYELKLFLANFSKLFIAIIIVLNFYHNNIMASFWDEKARGWHWYEDPILEEEVTEEEKKLASDQSQPEKPPTAKEIIAKNKEILEESLAKAILSPTPENVQRYQELQHEMMERSSKFADVWAKSLLYNPNLDHRIQNPESQYAIKLNTARKFENRKKLIKEASKEYGFFYFFGGNCKFCHGFVQILAMFKEKYDWNILSVSMDGKLIPGLEQIGKVEVDNGISEKFNVVATPSLFLVHPSTGDVIPVGSGMMSLDVLEENIFTQITDLNEKLNMDMERE